MTGDSNYFRKRFLGGFNKADVVEYITELARERNELEAAKDKAEREAQSLANEVMALRRDAEETRRVLEEDIERKYSVFESAGDAFAEFEAVFRNLREEMEVAATNVFAELKNTVDITAKLPTELSQAGERFKELRISFNAKKSKTDRAAAETEGEAETEGGTETEGEAETDAVDATVTDAAGAPETDSADTAITDSVDMSIMYDADAVNIDDAAESQ